MAILHLFYGKFALISSNLQHPGIPILFLHICGISMTISPVKLELLELA
jgi:hypothetical protein